MSDSSTFAKILSALGSYTAQATPPPPATEVELQALERYVAIRWPGSTIPPALIGMWRACNGSPAAPDDPVPLRLFYSYMFMPVGRVLDECQALDGILAEPDPYPLNPVPSFPNGAVRDETYSAAWLPFAYDGCGGSLAVDFAPGPAGTMGQIINYGRDDAAHFQLATSFDGFLEQVLSDYRERRAHMAFGDDMLYIDRLLMGQHEHGN